MVVYDTFRGTVTLAAKTAVLSDIDYPSRLGSGATGHVTGYATNTGTESIYLIVDLVDLYDGKVLTSAGPVYTTPYSPMFGFDLTFIMPTHNLNFEVRLHD